MKTRFAIIVLIVSVLTVLLVAAGSSPVRRVSHGYIHVRPGGVTADDTALTVTTSAWTHVRDWVEIPEDWDSVSISLYAYGDGDGAGDPNQGVVDCNLYVAHEFGPAIHVCRFSVEVGNLRLSHDPEPGTRIRTDEAADTNTRWAEGPFTLTESFWRSPIWMSGKEDGVGELNFGHQGATRIRVNLDNMADATQWFVVMTGRK